MSQTVQHWAPKQWLSVCEEKPYTIQAHSSSLGKRPHEKQGKPKPAWAIQRWNTFLFYHFFLRSNASCKFQAILNDTPPATTPPKHAGQVQSKLQHALRGSALVKTHCIIGLKQSRGWELRLDVAPVILHYCCVKKKRRKQLVMHGAKERNENVRSGRKLLNGTKRLGGCLSAHVPPVSLDSSSERTRHLRRNACPESGARRGPLSLTANGNRRPARNCQSTAFTEIWRLSMWNPEIAALGDAWSSNLPTIWDGWAPGIKVVVFSIFQRIGNRAGHN